MSSPEIPSLGFVKRAVLQSDEKGHTFDVELDATAQTDDSTTTKVQIPLYEQLAKNIAERREQRVEGRPEELTIEDQEFVNRVMRQKDEEALQHEEEAKEFKRQRLLTAASAAATSTASPREIVTSLLDESKNGDVKRTNGIKEDDGLPIVILKKKKKKPAAAANPESASTLPKHDEQTKS